MNSPFAANLSANINSQQNLVLRFLQKNPDGLNRFEAYNDLNICHLAGRIVELRNRGHFFLVVKETTKDSSGRVHFGIARYFWNGFKQPERKASNLGSNVHEDDN